MTTTKTKRKNKLPAEARDNLPRVSVTLTDESAWITRYDERGKAAATYPASMIDIANALRSAGARSTGLVPEGLLFQTDVAGQVRVGLWLPPAKRTLVIDASRGAHQLPVWLPGLVLVGQGRMWWIYAASARPAKPTDRLYNTPLPNVHGDGRICQGSAKFPLAAPGTLLQAAAVFFESEFNADLGDSKIANYRGTTLAFLRGLRGQFPAGRLIDAGLTIGQVVNGQKVEDEGEAGGDGWDNEANEPIGLWE